MLVRVTERRAGRTGRSETVHTLNTPGLAPDARRPPPHEQPATGRRSPLRAPPPPVGEVPRSPEGRPRRMARLRRDGAEGHRPSVRARAKREPDVGRGSPRRLRTGRDGGRRVQTRPTACLDLLRIPCAPSASASLRHLPHGGGKIAARQSTLIGSRTHASKAQRSERPRRRAGQARPIGGAFRQRRTMEEWPAFGRTRRAIKHSPPRGAPSGQN